MLRYIYLLGLVIFINLSFCFEYSSCSRLNRKNLKYGHRYEGENPQPRKQFKRYDYNMYDKDPVAEIDVASFINSAEDESDNGYEPDESTSQKIIYDKTYYDDGSLTKELSNINEDYYNPIVKSVQQTSQYLKLDAPKEIKKIDDNLPQGFNKFLHSGVGYDDNIIGRQNIHHQEKKCILKNIKIPFFSHNHSATINSKKEDKRKINGLRGIGKENKMLKGKYEKVSRIGNSDTSRNIYEHDKIKKRSYIERLCPICKRKFTVLKNEKSQSKRNYNTIKNLHGIKHTKSDENVFENTNEPLNKYDIDESKTLNNKVFENYWSTKRVKREEDRNVERQKELDFLEKKIESVTIHNSPDNKPSINKVVENYWSDKRRKREDNRNVERQKELEYLEERIKSVTVNNAADNKAQP